MKWLVVVLGMASALDGAAPAQADPGVDASFVDALTKAGISFSDPKNAVDAGHTACGLMDQGKSELQVVQLVMQQNSGLSTISAAKFTAIAASAYCPQHQQQASGGVSSSSQAPDGGVGGSGGQQ